MRPTLSSLFGKKISEVPKLFCHHLVGTLALRGAFRSQLNSANQRAQAQKKNALLVGVMV